MQKRTCRGKAHRGGRKTHRVKAHRSRRGGMMRGAPPCSTPGCNNYHKPM